MVLYSSYPGGVGGVGGEGKGGEERKKHGKAQQNAQWGVLTRQITFLGIWSVALTLKFCTLMSVLASPGSFPLFFSSQPNFPSLHKHCWLCCLLFLPCLRSQSIIGSMPYSARIVSWILHTVQMCMSDVQSSEVNASVDRNCGRNITNQSQENCCVF